MGKTTPSDSIYRAAIDAAQSLDKNAPLSRDGVCLALRSALERHGVAVQAGSTADRADMIVAGADGILVGCAGEERSGELTSLLRGQGWQRAHHVSFGGRTLSIKTVSA